MNAIIADAVNAFKNHVGDGIVKKSEIDYENTQYINGFLQTEKCREANSGKKESLSHASARRPQLSLPMAAICFLQSCCKIFQSVFKNTVHVLNEKLSVPTECFETEKLNNKRRRFTLVMVIPQTVIFT